VHLTNTNAIDRGFESSGNCKDDVATFYNKEFHVYCCKTDLCNEASMGKANYIFAVISGIMGFLLIK